jgi:hypothetical protein
LGPYFQAIWLHWICLGIIVAMVLLGSIVFAAPSSNATICLIVIVGIMFAGGHLNGVAIGMRGAGATIYGLLYAGFLLGLTWLVFRRKSLAV